MTLSSSHQSSVAERRSLAEAFARLTIEAGVAVMGVYKRECRVALKADRSPVSEADELAEAIILEGLLRCAPGVPVLAEESASRGVKPALDGCFILVDPVDGTREFLGQNGEFTVNIALVEQGRPVVGAVYAPALGRLWMGADAASRCPVQPGQSLPAAADREPIAVRTAPPGRYAALASRSHGDDATEAFLARLPIAERTSAGSSLKFCRLAEGAADVYPRFGPTMEWDTAAGDAVLCAAGGAVIGVDDEPLAYGKTSADYRNGGFVAWGDPSIRVSASPAGPTVKAALTLNR